MARTGITRFMSEQVTISSLDASASRPRHDNQYINPTTHDARVVRNNRMVKDQDGEEVMSTTQVYIEDDVTVAIDDRVELPDGSTPDIIGIQKRKKPNATVHHTRIDLE